MNKSRSLSPYQFFEIVQIEYICAILRARIYKSKKDKEFWNKVATGKKVKIEEIAHRNSLPTIFTDSDLNETLSKRVYIEQGSPCFVYRNEEHKLEQQYYDLYYYYNEGSEVRFLLDTEMVVGSIVEYKVYGTTIKVKYKEETLVLPVHQVMRVL